MYTTAKKEYIFHKLHFWKLNKRKREKMRTRFSLTYPHLKQRIMFLVSFFFPFKIENKKNSKNKNYKFTGLPLP